jgi:hypothetical protein
MHLSLVTFAEIIGVIVGFVLLGIVGTVVTPSPPQALPVSPAPLVLDPKDVIAEAQEGYQVDTCVRDITRRVVLADGASGTPELILVEGAPVTECFPGLSEFIEEHTPPKAGEEKRVPERPAGGFGPVVSTSVVVLPRSSDISTTTASAATASSTGEGVVVVQASSSASSQISGSVPSGGSTGWTPNSGTIPSVSDFDACRIRLFGDVIPETLTEEEQQEFQACLSGESADDAP